MSNVKSTVLITGASTGLGAVYADRFARRGHSLVLVARDTGRLEALAARLRADAGVEVDVLTADLTKAQDVAKVETRVAEDSKIGVLVNNAGVATESGFGGGDLESLYSLVDINVVALTRLAGAAAQRFRISGGGAIINISSVVALAPQWIPGTYGASKAYVLALSRAMQAELGGQGVYVQAVLPATTRTEIWERSGRDVNTLTGVMSAEDLVDAALVGFDAREEVTIPPLPDEAQWQAFEAAREAMLPNFAQEHPAARYRPAAG